jgi:cyclic beta-1,2-glucan synthetase
MHRAALESMFGLVQHGDEIAFRPCLPTAWDEAEMSLARGGKKLRVLFVRVDGEVPPAAPGTLELQPGERLRWSALPGEATYRLVLSLPARRIDEATAKAGAPVG